MSSMVGILILIVGFILVMNFIAFTYLLNIWMRALVGGHPMSIWRIIGMKLRRVDPRFIVECRLRAANGGVDVSYWQLEKHYLAGGKPERVVDALIKAHNRDIDVPFEIVAKTDLAGFDLDQVAPEQFRKAMEQQS